MPRSRTRAIDAACVCLLLFGSYAVFRGSTGHIQNCDSTYSLVVAEKLWKDGSVDLAESIPQDPALRQAMQGSAGDLPYQLIRRPDPVAGPHVYYGYPLGSSILSVPFVASLETRRGLTMFHADGRPNTAVEDQLQLRIAALICAAIVASFYGVCRFHCSPAISLLIAVGFAFGSPVWSTMARSLWSHDWMVLLLSASILLVMVRGRMEGSGRTDFLIGTALGTLQFWMLFVRSHGIFSTLAIGLYLLLNHRRMLMWTVVAGSAWMAAGAAVSFHAFGVFPPPTSYSLDTIDRQDVLNRFAWLMLSPSRGLLVFCPYVAVSAGILATFRKQIPGRSLLVPGAVAIGGTTALLACYNGWHMGSSYGPRYFCDVLPWFVLLTARAVRAIADSCPTWTTRLAAVLLATCFAWGVFVHFRGANSIPAWLWNARSIAVGQDESVKDWRHPQFLAGITFAVQLDGSITEAAR